VEAAQVLLHGHDHVTVSHQQRFGCQQPQWLRQVLRHQQPIERVVVVRVSLATPAAWAALMGRCKKPLDSMAATSASGSAAIFLSRALMAISQIKAADTYTASAYSMKRRVSGLKNGSAETAHK
jgi:hypothetical protein